MVRKSLALAAAAALALLPLALHAQSADQPGPYKVLQTVKVGGDGGFDYVTADSDKPHPLRRALRRRRPHRRLQPRHLRPGRRHPRRQRPRRRGRHRDRPRLRHLQAHHHVRRQDLRRHQEDRRPGQSRRLPQRHLQPPLLRPLATPRPTSPSSTTRTAPILGTIDIGGAPEQAVTDGKGHIYVDIEDKDAIAVIDANTMKMTGKYDLSSKSGGCAGLALDAKNNILFAACRDKNDMVILSATDGHIIADLPIGAAATERPSTPPPWRPSARRATARSPSSRRTRPPASPSSRPSPRRSRAKTLTLDTKTGHILLITAEYGAPPGTARTRSRSAAPTRVCGPGGPGGYRGPPRAHDSRLVLDHRRRQDKGSEVTDFAECNYRLTVTLRYCSRMNVHAEPCHSHHRSTQSRSRAYRRAFHARDAHRHQPGGRDRRRGGRVRTAQHRARGR